MRKKPKKDADALDIERLFPKVRWQLRRQKGCYGASSLLVIYLDSSRRAHFSHLMPLLSKGGGRRAHERWGGGKKKMKGKKRLNSKERAKKRQINEIRDWKLS